MLTPKDDAAAQTGSGARATGTPTDTPTRKTASAPENAPAPTDEERERLSLRPDSPDLLAGWAAIDGARHRLDEPDRALGNALKLTAGLMLSGATDRQPDPEGTLNLRLASYAALRQAGTLGPALLFLDLAPFTRLDAGGRPRRCGPVHLRLRQMVDAHGEEIPDGPAIHLLAHAHSQPAIEPAWERPTAKADTPAQRQAAARRALAALDRLQLAEADPITLGQTFALYADRLIPRLGAIRSFNLLAGLAASVCEADGVADQKAAQITHEQISPPGLNLGTWQLTLGRAAAPGVSTDLTLGLPGRPGLPTGAPAARILHTSPDSARGGAS